MAGASWQALLDGAVVWHRGDDWTALFRQSGQRATIEIVPDALGDSRVRLVIGGTAADWEAFAMCLLGFLDMSVADIQPGR